MTKTITKTTVRSAPAGGIAGLVERRRQAMGNARRTWADLVRMAADGAELDMAQCEALGEAGDLLELDNLEESFNADCSGLRGVLSAEQQLAEIREENLPQRMVNLAAEIKQAEDRLRQLRSQRETCRIRFESCSLLTREIGDQKAKLPRVFPN